MFCFVSRDISKVEVFDRNGNLYGVTSSGGPTLSGTVFQLAKSGSNWQENVLHFFTARPDGIGPAGSVAVDGKGRVYGTTETGGTGQCGEPHNITGCGTVFEVAFANGSWHEAVIHSFINSNSSGKNPFAGVIRDSAGNLYGTTAYDVGSVFELSPAGRTSSFAVLHTFGGSGDGIVPYGGLVRDASGNLYGTANRGGAHNEGIAFEVTP